MARVPYPAGSQVAGAMAEAGVTSPTPLNLLRMVAHAPALTPPVVALGTTVLSRLDLTPRHREMLILLVARRTRCPYQLVQHRPIARAAGLSPHETEAISDDWRSVESFSVAEQALLAAGEELLAAATWQAATLTELRHHFTLQQIVEICFVVGYYQMIAALLNALGVDVDPKGEKFARMASRRSRDTADR